MSGKGYSLDDFDFDNDFDLDDDLEDLDAFDDEFFAGIDLGDDSEWDEIEAFLSEHEEEGRGQTAPRRTENSYAEDPAASAVPSPPQEAPVPTLGTMIKAMIATVVVCLLILAVFVIVPRIGKESDSEVDGATPGIHHTEVEQSDNNTLNDDITYYDVLNGSKTEVIGQRGVVSLDKTFLTSQVTEEQFIEYVSAVVKDSGCNWFTIDFGDGTGIVFVGSMIEFFDYGTLDDIGRADKIYCTAYLRGDHYTYIVDPWQNDGEEAASLQKPPYVNSGKITITRSDLVAAIDEMHDEGFDPYFIGQVGGSAYYHALYESGDFKVCMICDGENNEHIKAIMLEATIGKDNAAYAFGEMISKLITALYGKEKAVDIATAIIDQLNIGAPTFEGKHAIIDNLFYSYGANADGTIIVLSILEA